MSNFQKEYNRLNSKQKQAVELIDGPVLVVAGPGTGKTQLLAMRAANILRKADVSPYNILCLTFTDNAARNMRKRLAGIIGQPAYHVSIQTFHSFGSDVINQYPDNFIDRELLQQVDELGRYELLREIFEDLPHSDPLSTKVGDQFIFLKNTMDAISQLKQNGLAPEELRKIINANQEFINALAGDLAETFATTPSAKQLSSYLNLLSSIKKHSKNERHFGFPGLADECAFELQQAIEKTDSDGRYAKPITAWRDKWCKKDSDNKFIFKDGGMNIRKMYALADVYQKMLDSMAEQGLYDFDDMVVETVHAMENNDELRLNLQERYQYVLVDEFQDTNKAQLRMLACLGSNPVHENRPNIMAVGDDDQAIYAFQGAEVSNMAAFFGMYDEPKLITLDENYRSNSNILKNSSFISAQITDRLEEVVPSAGKQLSAQIKHKTDVIEHLSFSSELAQYDWIAERIYELINDGAKPEEIAVIAPRHKYLERLMPYLGNKKIPVAYERRENILEAPIVKQLITMSELVVAIAENRQDDVDVFISQVLAYDFWGVPSDELVKTSIDCYDKHKHWLDVLPKSNDKNLREITAWFVSLAKKSTLEPMEYILDELIGTQTEGKKQKFISPMRDYYFNKDNYERSTDIYLVLLGQLSTLRQRLRQWKPNRTLYVKDLVEFSELYMSASLKVVDTNPHTQAANAVQVMTAYKAKGLEFGSVFIINAQDEVWGPTARSQSSRLSLPRNLPIEPAGSEDNDKLRLLFVAMTRARHTLYMTGYTHSLDNKPSPILSFLENNIEPKKVEKPATPQAKEILATDWSYRFRQIIADKKTLLEPILENYKLSVTHLNNFLDVKDGGPEYFFTHNLLRFPEAMSPSAAYGDSVHKTLQWAHAQLVDSGKLPSIGKVQDYFSGQLKRKYLKKSDAKKLNLRGRDALEVYLKQKKDTLSITDKIERGFNNEGVVVNGANLSGKIDKLSFDESGSAFVADFKTGKPAKSWKARDEYEKIKLHKYRQQLLFYKLLVENSASFGKRLTVNSGSIEFIEVDEQGKLTDELVLAFDPDEITRFATLISAVWTHINNLDFPDTSKYPKNLTGIKQFEEDLLKNKI
ncbi:MAG TPA: ATP-dependent DNA helicase [Candidatus Saccharimonadales bacterium]|nr:ATP-dependent DNA helicase [Candidatus Saccharimonadales bacterium]